MSIDPRLMERRKAVAEGRASHSLRRSLKLIVVFSVVGFGVWLALSPWFSVSQVRTTGIVSSDANQIMVASDVVAGTPMVLLRTGDVIAALEEDPWVAQAHVHLKWPDEVVVRVIERVPVAWVMTDQGWTRRAIDGMAVPSTSIPDETMPTIELPAIPSAGAEGSPMVLGAVEFAAAMAASYPNTVVRMLDGELWAVVAGFDVRLGRPEEMLAKARSLEALLEERIPEGSVLILIAPSHPAIRTPVEQAAEG